MFDGIMRSPRRKPRVVQARFDITTSGEPNLRYPATLAAAKLSRAQRTGTGAYEFETVDPVGLASNGAVAVDNAGASYGTIGVTNEDRYAQWDLSVTAEKKVVISVMLKNGANNADPSAGGRLSIWIHYDGAP